MEQKSGFIGEEGDWGITPDSNHVGLGLEHFDIVLFNNTSDDDGVGFGCIFGYFGIGPSPGCFGFVALLSSGFDSDGFKPFVNLQAG